MAKRGTPSSKKTPTGLVKNAWVVRNRDTGFGFVISYKDELDARIFAEEVNSSPEVNREQMKVFFEG